MATAANLNIKATSDTSDATSGLNSLNKVFQGVRDGLVNSANAARSAVADLSSLGSTARVASTALTMVSEGARAANSEAARARDSFGGLEGALTRASAAGHLLASGIQAAAGGIVEAGKSAFDTVANFERMSASMNAMAAKEMLDLGQFDDFDKALASTKNLTQELLDWSQQLAIVSPFGMDDVSSAMSVAQAFGFLATQYKTTQEAQKEGVITAQRLTEATMNWAAATGKAGSEIQRVTLIAGQIKAMGKLMGGDSMQLKQVGINIEGLIGKAINKTQAEVVKMREDGLIPAELALQALVGEMEKFGNAAAEQGNTLGGMMASLQDLGKIAQRNLFGGIFDAIKPQMAAAITTLQNPAFLGALKGIGDQVGAGLASILSTVGSAFAQLQQSGAIAATVAGIGNAFQVASVLAGVFLQTVVPLGASLLTLAQGLLTSATSSGLLQTVMAGVLGLLGGVITGVMLLTSVLQLVATGGVSASEALQLLGVPPAVVTGIEMVVGAFTVFMGMLPSIGALLQSNIEQRLMVLQVVLMTVGAVVGAVAQYWPLFAGAAATALGAVLPLVQMTSSFIDGLLVAALVNLQLIAGPAVAAIAVGFSTLSGIFVGIASVVQGVLGVAFTNLTVAANMVFATIGQLVLMGITTLTQLGTIIGTALLGGLTMLAPVVQMALGSIPALVGLGLAVLTQLASIVQTVLVGAFTVIAPLVQAAFGGIATILSLALPPLTNLVMILGTGLLTALTAIQPYVALAFTGLSTAVQVALPYIQQLATFIGTGLATGLTLVGQLVQMAFAALPGILAIVMPPLMGLGQIVGQFLVTAFQTIAPLAQQAFSTLGSVVASALPFVQGLAMVVGSVLLAAFQAAVPIVGAVVQAVGGMLPAAAGVASAALNIISAGARILFPVLQFLAGLIGTALVVAFKVLQVVVPPVITALGGLASFLLGAVAGALRGIAGIINWAADHWKLFASVAVAAIALLTGPIGLGIALVVGLASAWSSNLGDIRGKVADAVHFVTEKFNELLGNLNKIGEGIAGVWNWLTGRTAEETGAQAEVVAVNYGYAAESAVTSSGYMASGVESYMGDVYSVSEGYSGAAAESIAGNMDYATASAIDSQVVMADVTYATMGSVYDSVDSYGSASQQSLAENFGVAGDHVDAGLSRAEGVTNERMHNAWASVKAYVARIKAELASIGVDGGGGGTSERDEIQREKNAMMKGQVEAARAAAKTGFNQKVNVPQVGFGQAPSYGGGAGGGDPLANAKKGAAPKAGAKGKTPKTPKEKTPGTPRVGAGKQAEAKDALASAQQAMDAITKMHEFKSSPAWADFQANEGEYRAIADRLAKFGQKILEIWANAGKKFSEDAGLAAKRLADGVQAGTQGATQVLTFAVELLKFRQGRYADALNDSSGLITTVEQMAKFALRVAQVWGEAGKGVNEKMLEAGSMLKFSIENATAGLTSTLTLIPQLVSFQAGRNAAALQGDISASPLIDLASRLAKFARAVSDKWNDAGVGLKGDLVSAGSLLKDAIEAGSAGLKATTSLIPDLLEFRDSPGMAVLTNGDLHTAVLALVAGLSAFARLVVDRWGAAGDKLSEDVVNQAKLLSDAIQASSTGLLAVTSLIPNLLGFYQSPGMGVLTNGELHAAVLQAATLLSSFARRVSDSWGSAADAIDAAQVESSKRLADSIQSASAGLLATISLVGTLLQDVTVGQARLNALAANQSNITGMAYWMGRWARDIARDWASAGSQLRDNVPASAAALSEGIKSASEGILTVVSLTQTLLTHVTTGNGVLQQLAANQSNITGMSYWMGRWARDIARDWASAGAQLSENVPAAATALKDGVEAASGGILTVVSLAQTLLAYVTHGNAILQQLAANQANITGMSYWMGRWARDIARDWASASASLAADVPAGAAALRDGVQAAAAGILSVYDLAQTLLDAVTKGNYLLQKLAANQANITGMAYWMGRWARDLARDWASAGNQINDEVVTGGTRLRDAIVATSAGILTTFDLVTHFLDVVRGQGALLRSLAANRDGITQLAQRLGEWARDLARDFAAASASLSEEVPGATSKLKDAIGNTLAGLQGALDTWRLLQQYSHQVGDGVPDLTLATRAYELARWAAWVTSAFNLAVEYLDTNFQTQANNLVKALQNTLAGITAAYDTWRKLLEYNSAVGDGVPELTLATRAYELARWAAWVTSAFNLAVEYLDTNFQTQANDLTKALQNTLSGITSAMDTWKALIEYSKAVGEGVPDPALATRAYELSVWATRVTNEWNRGAQTLDGLLVDAGGKLATAIQNALNGLKSTVEALRLLASLSDPKNAVTWSDGYTLLVQDLRTWAFNIASAWSSVEVTLEQTVIDAGGRLATAVQNAVGGLKSTVEALRLLASLGDPRNKVEWKEGYTQQVAEMRTWAFNIASAWNSVDATVAQELVDAGGRLSTAVQNAAGGLNSTVEVIRFLASLADPKNRVTWSDAYETQVAEMRTWAHRLASAWNNSQNTLDQDLVDAGGRLSTAVQNAASGVKSVTELLRTLASLADPRNSVTWNDAYEQTVARLALWAKKLAQKWYEAAGTLDQDLVEAGGRLSTATQNALSGVKAVTDLLRVLADLAKPASGVKWDDGYEQTVANLASWAKRLAQKWYEAAGTLDSDLVDAGGRLSTATQNALSGIRSVTDLILSLVDWSAKPPQFDLSALETTVGQLAFDARQLAQKFIDAAAGFTTDTTAADTLAKAIQNASQGLSSVMELLPSLQEWAKKPVRATPALLQLVDDLATDMRAIFDRVRSHAADLASDAAATTETMQKGFGASATMLTALFDLGPKLRAALPTYQRLGPTLLAQLDVMIDDIKAVFIAVKAKASDPEINTLAVQAVEALQKGAGAAFSMISGYLDLRDKLTSDQPSTGGMYGNLYGTFDRAGGSQGTLSDKVDGFISDIKAILDKFIALGSQYSPDSLNQAVALGNAVKSVFDAFKTSIDALRSFEAGVSGSAINNFSVWLGYLFDTFEQQRGRASAATEVATGLNAVVGAVQALKVDLGSIGTQSGVSLTTNLANAIRAGIPDVVAAVNALLSSIETSLQPRLLLPVRSPGDGQGAQEGGQAPHEDGGDDYYYTTYILVQQGDPESLSNSRQNFQQMQNAAGF